MEAIQQWGEASDGDQQWGNELHYQISVNPAQRNLDSASHPTARSSPNGNGVHRNDEEGQSTKFLGATTTCEVHINALQPEHVGRLKAFLRVQRQIGGSDITHAYLFVERHLMQRYDEDSVFRLDYLVREEFK